MSGLRGVIPLASVVALAVAAAACSSCDGDTAPVAPSPLADSGTGGAAGAAGSGGYFPGGGAAGQPIPDAAPDAPVDGDSRVDLTWKVLGTAAGCTIERVVNPEAVRLLEWIPCAETPDCEEARFLIREPVGDVMRVAALSQVHDNGEATRLALVLTDTFDAETSIAAFATADGLLVDAYRSTGPDGCVTVSAATWGNRFGVRAVLGGGTFVDKYPAILGSTEAATPTLCSVDTSPAGIAGGSATRVMGKSRWVWRSAPNEQLFSFSNTDCSGTYVFASTPLGGPIFALGRPSTTGDLFLFAQWEAAEDWLFDSSLYMSDGQSPPVPFLVPEAGVNYGTPLFAHSHLAWLRATGQQLSYSFDHVEWWASPYAGDPTSLQPFKVADTSFPTPEVASVGGFGFVATASGRDAQLSRLHEIGVWNLADKTVRYHMLPQSRDINGFLGISRTHVWMIAAKHLENRGDFFLRFPLK